VVNRGRIHVRGRRLPVDPYRRLLADLGRTRSRLGRERLGRCRIEGTRLHERALRAGHPVERALVSRTYAAGRGARERALLEEIERHGGVVEVADDAVLAGWTEGRDLGAIVGLVALPRPPALDDVLRADPQAVLLAVADVEDPGNTGALARAALAGGATALLVAGITDPYHPRALRTSMGSTFRLPVLRFAGARDLADALDAAHVPAWAAVSRDGVALPDVPHAVPHARGEPLAIVVGSEAFGLARETAERAALRVHIPMPAGVDSFSVHAAAAIFLYEVRCRRPRSAPEPEP